MIFDMDARVEPGLDESIFGVVRTNPPSFRGAAKPRTRNPWPRPPQLHDQVFMGPRFRGDDMAEFHIVARARRITPAPSFRGAAKRRARNPCDGPWSFIPALPRLRPGSAGMTNQVCWKIRNVGIIGSRACSQRSSS